MVCVNPICQRHLEIVLVTFFLALNGSFESLKWLVATIEQHVPACYMCVFVGSGFAIYLKSNSVFVYTTRFLKTIASSERLFRVCRFWLSLLQWLGPFDASGAPNNSGGTRVSCTQLRNTMWGVHFLRFWCVGMALLFLDLPKVVSVSFEFFPNHLSPGTVACMFNRVGCQNVNQPSMANVDFHPLFHASSRCLWTNKIFCAGSLALSVVNGI